MSIDLSPPRPPQAKVDGPRHVLAAATYSFGGFQRLSQETAFRHELLAAALVFFGFAFAGVDGISYFVQAMLLLMLLAVEALNTAIELIVDRVSPELSIFAKQAKDLGSFAVSCLLATNILFALFAIYNAV